jgi:hypothetical protein
MSRKNNWESYTEPEQRGSGHPRVIPKDVLRKIAKASSSGGRAQCHYCHEYFAMYYMKMCKISHFLEDFVCVDCRKDHNN